MPRKLLKYEPPTNRITWFTTWNYAVRNYYSDDINHIPTYPDGNDHNSNVLFRANDNFVATVDWGDGIIEVFSPYKNSSGQYVLIFRALNAPQKKNPNGSMGWDTPASGYKVTTVPPHHYEDDRQDIQRTIVVSFNASIDTCTFDTAVMTQMPILEIPDLKRFSLTASRFIKEFRFDKLEASPNLASMQVDGIGDVLPFGSKTKEFPKGVLAMTDLESLKLTDSFNFSDIESSGIRGISNLKKLKTLNLGSNGIGKYLKEYNDLPNLTELEMYTTKSQYPGSITNEEFCETPSFDEVDKINQNLEALYWIAGWDDGEYGDCWHESISGKGIDKLTIMPLLLKYASTTVFPEYLKEMRSCWYFKWCSLFNTQERADQVPVTLYDYMKGWDNLTMSQTAKDGQRNQFYGCTIEGYVAANSSYGDKIPSGEYMAPNGFEEGVSDGNPSTPMEYVYVLVHNYNQKWTFKGQTFSRSINLNPRWSLFSAGNKAVITVGEVKSKDNDVMKFDSFDDAVEEAYYQGLDISGYADNPYYDISHLLNRGGVVVDLQIITLRKGVQYAA